MELSVLKGIFKMKTDIQEMQADMETLNRRAIVLSGILKLMKISPDSSEKEIADAEDEIFMCQYTANNLKIAIGRIDAQKNYL